MVEPAGDTALGGTAMPWGSRTAGRPPCTIDRAATDPAGENI